VNQQRRSGEISASLATLDSKDEANENNIDQILQQMQQQGVFRKAAISDAEGDEDVSSPPFDAGESINISVSLDGGDASARPETEGPLEDNTTFKMAREEADEEQEEEEEINFANGIASEKVPEDDELNITVYSPNNQTNILTELSAKTSKSILLREIIKGIISPNEVKGSFVYNVER
jgi:uncharacterized Zn finger protein